MDTQVVVNTSKKSTKRVSMATTGAKLQATPAASKQVSRANSQVALSNLEQQPEDVIPSLEKLPTNVFLDKFIDSEENEDDAGTDRRATTAPAQTRGAKLAPLTDEGDDLETVLDANALESRRYAYDDTGQIAYTNACRKFNALPCASFYRKLQDSSHINLSNYNLGSRGAMAVCIPLVINSRVTAVNLASNDLREEGITYVGKMMAENECITELNLSSNNLRTHGAKVISTMLHDNHVLKSLDISSNNFSSSDAVHLTQAIEEHPALRSVNLSHNDFGETSCHLFKKMISENGTLQELDLQWCQFRGKGAVEIAKGVKENVGMKTLNLGWNGFGEEGAIAMAVALKQCTLVKLDLTNNRIRDEGFGCLIKSLKDNEYLKTLILAKNPIPEDAALAGLDFILKKMDDLKLDELNFDDILYGMAFKLKQDEVREKFTNLEITWGYSDQYGKRRMKEYNVVEDAMRAIGKYCQEHGIKIVDLFARFDTDDSMSVSHEEFAQGLREAKVPISSEQIDELINTLDQDGDGEIDFSEMVLGAELYKDEDDKEA